MIIAHLYKKHSKATLFPHLSHSPTSSQLTQPKLKLKQVSNGGQGGGRAPGRQPLLGAPANRHGGAGRRRQGLQGASPGPDLRGLGAHLLVLLPRRHRRVPGHLPVPLHLGPHRDGRGGEPVRVQVRHGGHPGHRVELRGHDLRAGVLHRRHLRRPHQPRGHLRAVPGQEAVLDEGGVLHGDAVLGSDLRRRRGEGVPDHPVHGQRRRRQLRRARVHQGGRFGGGDRRHVRAGLHRVLGHRRQAQRQRLPRPDPCPASDRVRRVPGAPGDDPHHRHRHQPGEVARRRHHLQQEAVLGRPLDLLGRPVHWRGAGGDLPRGGDQGDPLQEPRLVSQPWESLLFISKTKYPLIHQDACACVRTWIISGAVNYLPSCSSPCACLPLRLSRIICEFQYLYFLVYFPSSLLYCTVRNQTYIWVRACKCTLRSYDRVITIFVWRQALLRTHMRIIYMIVDRS